MREAAALAKASVLAVPCRGPTAPAAGGCRSLPDLSCGCLGGKRHSLAFWIEDRALAFPLGSAEAVAVVQRPEDHAGGLRPCLYIYKIRTLVLLSGHPKTSLVLVPTNVVSTPCLRLSLAQSQSNAIRNFALLALRSAIPSGLSQESEAPGRVLALTHCPWECRHRELQAEQGRLQRLRTRQTGARDPEPS